MDATHAHEHLPHKTIERLSQYRRALLICQENNKTFIFSHEIAKIQHITAVQVRRDLMLIGYSGTLRQGYNIQDLIDLIGEIIDSKAITKVAIMGLGDLGHALLNYLHDKRSKLDIAVIFDVNPDKIGKLFNGIPCYSVEEISRIISEKNISIGIITVPAKQAPVTAKRLIDAGIKGILNYTPTPIQVPKEVYLEEYDMITSLEKVAFYVKLANEKKRSVNGH